MGPITNKTRMYARLRAGLLGHTLPSAETPGEARELAERLGGTFAIRSKAASGPCRYGLSASEALGLAESLPAGSWNLSPMLDDAARVCYCHLIEAPDWVLHGTGAKAPARLRGEHPEFHLRGLAARQYVRGVMDQRGHDTLCELLECYPGHVVEFTCMADRASAFGPSRVIFWEVRAGTGEYEAPSWRWR